VKRATRELAARIKAARVAGGLTQEVLAAKSGIAYRRYQALESGRANTTFRTLVRIADTLGIDVWQLLGGTPAAGLK
jgi:transcriptional regulator with XRE-family HTH domain